MLNCSFHFPILQHLCISEMVVRVAKKRFRRMLQDSKSSRILSSTLLYIRLIYFVHCSAPVQLTSEAVAHFLNCFLSKSPFPEGTQEEVCVFTPL